MATPSRKSARWTGAETATVIWAPPGGGHINVTDYLVSITTACKVTVFEEVNDAAHLCFEIDGGAKGGAAMNLGTPIRTANGGGRLMVTTDGGAGVVTVYGYEEVDT